MEHISRRRRRLSDFILKSTMRMMKAFQKLSLLLVVLIMQVTSAFFLRRIPGRQIQLPQRWMASVTGTAYEGEGPVVVRLFTKEGCTLCDKVKDVLIGIREDHPHTLKQIDITDPGHEDWYSKYQWDIPVLHLGEQYWAKHRLDTETAKEGLIEAREGTFVERKGEPDAGEMERRQAEKEAN